MARAARSLSVDLKVITARISKDLMGSWRAGISLLLQLLRDERAISAAEEADDDGL